MNKLYYWSITSALAGFIFGFDTVVISGAEQTIQKLWGLSDVMHGLALGSALYGTVIGSLIGGWPTEKFGRKKTLFWVGVFYLIAAIGSGLAPEVWTLIAARFIGGLGIGISTIAAPLYISEISPPDKRGRLAGMFQFNIVFGILIAYLSNYLLKDVGEHAWRWMLGVAAFPSLVYMIMCFGIPESPRWLIGRGKDLKKGMDVLRMISPSASESEITATAREIEAHSSHSVKGGASTPFWSSRLKKPIALAFLIAFFN
ncbi:MAG: MFS transporter, partial [Verrucomicrobiaceae bacterium]